MGKEIRDAERGLVILSDCNLDLCPVLLYDDTMDGKGKGNPLILLYSAIVMGIEVYDSIALIKRLHLYIQTG